MKEKREKRLNSEFQREIYEILSTKVKNPDITEMYSVSEVDVSTDLKHCRVYISIYSMSKEAKERTFNAIRSTAPYIRGELGRRMKIRYIPELTILMDDSEEYGAHIDSLLHQISVEEEKIDE